MRLHRIRRLSPGLVGVALWAGLSAAVPARAADPGAKDPAPHAPAGPRRTPVVDVVERVRGAVVNIHSERTVQALNPEDLFAVAPSQNRVNGMGTGIVIDPRGYIVTNHHVVEDVNLLRVRLADGTTAGARVVARDHDNDLALLKVDVNRALPVMPLGTATDLMVGETVIAVGNAYGYDHTVTVGVVSAVKRDVTLNQTVSYKSLIQTDASINPGNSGGPLLNVNGELVGVNVAIRAGAQGIGFAIPVDTMMRVAADMLATRKRNPLWHGMVCRDRLAPDGGEAETVSTARPKEPQPLRRSLVVEKLEANGPAAKAGLQQGDTVLLAGDQRVACNLDLERVLLDRAAGDRLPLVVIRQGREQRLELTLQAAEKEAAVPADQVWRKLGLKLAGVTPDVVARGNPQLHGGLAVLDVRADGAAARAGIQRGDVLVGLHQWEMLTLDNVQFVLTHPDLATFLPLRFYIVRGGQVHRGSIPQLD